MNKDVLGSTVFGGVVILLFGLAAAYFLLRNHPDAPKWMRRPTEEDYMKPSFLIATFLSTFLLLAFCWILVLACQSPMKGPLVFTVWSVLYWCWKGLGIYRHHALKRRCSMTYDGQMFAGAWALHRKDYDAAVEAYTRAMELKSELVEANPDCAEFVRGLTQMQRGVVYLRMGELDSAMADFDRAVELLPEFWRPLRWRGRVWAARGAWPEALEEYARALACGKDVDSGMTLHCERGLAYLEMGELDKAAEDFRKGIAVESAGRGEGEDESAGTLRELRELGRESRDWEEEVWEEVWDAADLHFWLADALAWKEDWRGAVAECAAAMESAPDWVALRKKRGELYLENGEYALAVRDLTRAVRLSPKCAEAYRSRGRAYERMGKKWRAKRDAWRAGKI